MQYGLSDAVFYQMRNVFRNHPSVQRVVIFGSRAMQTHRAGSDIDLAIVGDQLTRNELLTIQIQLEELGYLYEFDVQDVKRIKNPELLEHIQRVGQVVYETDNS